MCTDGRHTLVGAIDVWSRRAKVLVVPESRATAICALLRACLIDWGVPQAVRTDEGRDYTSRHIVRVLADLGVAHDVCPPYTPEAKPFIERLFGTLTRDLFAFLPGFTGHSVADRKRLEARRSLAARRGQDARETFGVALTGKDLQERCDTWCEAVYGRRVHRTTGESPWARLASWTLPLRRIADPRALDPLLAAPVSTSGDGSRRTVGKRGIQVGGTWFIAPDLGARVGERVEVRHDPADPARLYVFTLEGSFLCIAVDPERCGADRTEIAAQAKAGARRADSAAREGARDLARTHGPEGAMDAVLADARTQAGNVIALPRAGAAHETQALRQAGRAADADAGARRGRRTAPKAAVDAAARLLLDGDHEWHGQGGTS